FQIAPDGRDIKRDALNYKLNGTDEYALEEAVRLKEKSGGRVIALTAGPKRTEQMLREALAKGADEVVRIAFDEPAAYDVGKGAPRASRFNSARTRRGTPRSRPS